MSRNKKHAPIFETISEEEQDFFINFLKRKAKAVTKKLKEIDQLEQKGQGELKEEQIKKISSKEEKQSEYAELEVILKTYFEAQKELTKSKENVNPNTKNQNGKKQQLTREQIIKNEKEAQVSQLLTLFYINKSEQQEENKVENVEKVIDSTLFSPVNQEHEFFDAIQKQSEQIVSLLNNENEQIINQVQDKWEQSKIENDKKVEEENIAEEQRLEEERKQEVESKKLADQEAELERLKTEEVEKEKLAQEKEEERKNKIKRNEKNHDSRNKGERRESDRERNRDYQNDRKPKEGYRKKDGAQKTGASRKQDFVYVKKEEN